MLMACMMLAANLLAAPGAADPAAAAEKIFQSLGFTAGERARLQKGEIVSHGVKELSDKELAITMAVLVPTPLADLLEFARSSEALEINREILAHGALGAGAADDKSLQEAGFSAAEAEEIRDLFAVEPGSKFNLSQAEMEIFSDLRARTRS